MNSTNLHRKSTSHGVDETISRGGWQHFSYLGSVVEAPAGGTEADVKPGIAQSNGDLFPVQEHLNLEPIKYAKMKWGRPRNTQHFPGSY